MNKFTSVQRRILSEMDVPLRRSERKHRASPRDLESESAYLVNLVRAGRMRAGQLTALAELGYKPAVEAAGVSPAKGDQYPYRITFQQALSLLLQLDPESGYQAFLTSLQGQLREVFKAVLRSDLSMALQGTQYSVDDIYTELVSMLEEAADAAFELSTGQQDTLEYIEDSLIEDYEMDPEVHDSLALLYDLMYIDHLLNNDVDAPFYTPVAGYKIDDLSEEQGLYWFHKHLKEFVDNFVKNLLS